MEIQHLILSPGMSPEERTEPLPYDKIVETVGYPVEVINIEGQAVMYVCEEAKQRGWPRNEEATKIAASNLRQGDHVAGTALIVGPLGPGGIDTSLSNETLNDLLDRLR